MEKGIKNFYDLKVWRDSHSLELDIYKTTKTFPQEEKFGLVSQMRRAISSGSANIAEGFGRFHYGEKIKFYQQARGSVVELQNHLFLAKDLRYIPESDARELFKKSNLIIKEINGLISAINKQRNLHSDS